MNYEDFRRLSPTQAMQAAAEELALPTDFFDKMWAQESGRGKNKLSPAGARGDFQIMPKTQAAWERRHGKAFNSDDFHDSLFMASETMRENLAKFKDPVDATRAYNGGWDAKKWGNPETVGYVAALWGDKAPARGPAAPSAASRPEGWPTLPTRAPKGSKADPDADADTAALIAIGTSASRLAQDAAGVDSSRVNAKATEAEAVKVQARKGATGVGDVVSDALRDPRIMPTWAILSRFDEDREVDPNFDYMALRDKLEDGLSDDEREYLRENAVSESTATRARAEIEYRRGLDQTYGDAGGLAAFTGQMTAGMADPASLLLGMGTMKAFQMARIGSGALAARGAGGAAAASMLAENAAANVAIEGVADAMGEVKTTADYALAATAGAVIAAPFTRGAFRQASEANLRTLARETQERAVAEQHAKVTAVMDKEPHLTPEQVARRVEQDEAEAISRAVDESTGPQRMDQVVPENVRKEMEDEFAGITEEPDAPPQPKLNERDNYSFDEANAKREEFLRQQTETTLQQIRDKGTVTRERTDAATGQTITLEWSAKAPKLRGHGNAGQALDAVQGHPLASPLEKRVAKYLSSVISKDGLDVEVRITGRDARSNFDPNTKQVAIYGKGAAGDDLPAKVNSLNKYGVYSILHEIAHVATYHRINAWEKAPDKLRPEQRRVMEQFQDLFNRFKASLDETLPKSSDRPEARAGSRYAATNLHEFAAQFFTDRETRNILSILPGKPVAGRATSALREMMSLVKRVLGLEGKNAFEEGAKLIDQMIAMPVDNIAYSNGKAVFSAYDSPQPLEAGVNPQIAQRSREKWQAQMVQHARDYMARNPIDLARLNVLTAKIGGVSDGLRLAMSKNPVLQLVASLVTETTTGAAGRKANVAIRSYMLHGKFQGNAMIDYQNSYNVFRGRNGGNIVEDAWAGNTRRKFDQKVTEEILSRRRDGYIASNDASVVEAADALEALFERARLGQIDAGVLGFANLPGTARGYLPQALDGTKLQAMSTSDMALLHQALAEQFQSRLGFDKKFAESFAPFYTERVRLRAMGEKNMDGLGAGGDGLQLVRDTLEEFDGDPAMLDRARAALSTQGQGHTKKRLDVDLLTELRPGLRMMDFYVTNPLILARSYAKRTAGTVSLTEAGIHGIRGIRELRQAALYKQDGTAATDKELEAFDRVMSEILGTPVAGQVVSAGASNLQLLVSLQRLGGLVFTQAAETFNMVHHLGWRATLSGLKAIPRMMGEVGRLKQGGDSRNHILTSMEVQGGEFGMDSYKLIAPLDAPDDRLAQYMDQPGLVSRLMRAGGHLQSKISGFRGLMAAQHRVMAEQIVMRAARYIRDGKHDIELADMGFTPEIAASLRADLKHIAKWDANDRLVEFDLTRVSDARTAEAFVQAVHRGTSQIIQGTFIGERNAWFHNDYLRLALQFRTFGLTATEKQWGRTRANHNFAYAGAMMFGQMVMAAPIHFARIHMMAAGREDREQYVKNSTTPAAMVRATMNYSSLSGLTGDVLEIMSGVAGGWGDARTKEIVGARQQSASAGRILPFLGTIDKGLQVVSGKADLHTSLKQLPFSNLWYLVPAINLTKD